MLVIGREIVADFSGFVVELIQRDFETSDLDSVALVFMAESGADAELAKATARARHIPLNVVDVLDECDFYTPSIVDRAPLTVAISSEGDAPVLARLMRARIEAMLPPGLGKIARLAGGLRQHVENLIQSAPARQRFYEALVSSPQIKAAMLRGADAGRSEAEALLEQHRARGESAGIVWLIGAGPGSEDLLILRVQRRLLQADVIVHDDFWCPIRWVQMGRRDAEQISVGKAKGHHSFSQAQINTLIVRLVRQGKKVARLKSDDPMVFGHAGEEIVALRKADIAYAIVPGVSAAMAAAADTATPVTLRKVSSGFVMATAHGSDDSELSHWAALTQSGLALALYMGKSIASEVARRLVANGASPSILVGIVVNAGRPEATSYSGNLASLMGYDGTFADGPAIILVGEGCGGRRLGRCGADRGTERQGSVTIWTF